MPSMTAMLRSSQKFRPIVTLGAPVLRQIAARVPESMFNTPKLDTLVEDMVDAMRNANGAGIAAPQIGEPWRVFAVHGTGANPRYPYKPIIPLTIFVNPELEILDGPPMQLIEGCLSIPGMRGRVRRASRVRCTARRPDGSEFVMVAEGHAAGTLQHELDHLNGVLFPDISQADGLMTWDAFEEFHKDDFFAYAKEINEIYPTPIKWEIGAPSDGTNLDISDPRRMSATKVTDEHDGAESIYQADLTWTGTTFERDVCVGVDNSGHIAFVDRRDSVDSENVRRLKNQALIPGFVNAHSHAFQRGLRGRGETYPQSDESDVGDRPSFWTWREAMYDLVTELNTVEAFKAQVLQCFQEMASAGITTVGEFHYFRHAASDPHDETNFAMDIAVLEAAREANVRLVLLAACYQRGGFDDRPLGPGQRHFQTPDLKTYWHQLDNFTKLLDVKRGEAVGAVVHSLRAVRIQDVQSIAAEATRRQLPLHLHLEEQPQEIADCQATHKVTPLGLLLQSVPAEQLSRTCAVHCTHSSQAELAEFAKTGASVCICPLTEGSLGDGVFLSPEATGGAVSLGTDCNARIDMFEEMRWLEYTQRLARGQRGVFSTLSPSDGTGELSRQLFECATIHGARDLQVDTGTLEPGKWADFALLDLNAPALSGSKDADLLGAAVFGGSAEGLVNNTCTAGTWTRPLE